MTLFSDMAASATAASGQVPKRADTTTSSGVEGIPAAVACLSTGSLGP
jgi:hypothetical protein